MKKHYNYSSRPYKIFNLNDMCAKYEKLKMLKNSLGFDEDKEINEDLIFDFVSKHNYNEFYLLEYMINKTIYAPKEITAQNFHLISLYDRPEEYKKIYNATKELYKNKLIFKKFASSMNADLYLHDKDNCKLFNYQVYELCSRYITDKIILEPLDVYLNLHFIQKWIFEQTKFKLGPFTDVEKEIIYNIKHGRSALELTKEDFVKGEQDKEFLNTIIHRILPAKCRVETINQVMAVVCCHYPNPARIQPLSPERMKKLKEMLESGAFGEYL